MASTHLWIRPEARATERRAPVVPADVRRLLEAGSGSPSRTPRSGSSRRGVRRGRRRDAEPGSWTDAPDDVFVVGIKELPDGPRELRHRHVYFAHAFKGQSDATETLGGSGAAAAGSTTSSTSPTTRPARGRLRLLGRVRRRGARRAAPGRATARHRCTRWTRPSSTSGCARPTTPCANRACAGDRARGRSGRGAQAALAVAGPEPTTWDRKETRGPTCTRCSATTTGQLRGDAGARDPVRRARGPRPRASAAAARRRDLRRHLRPTCSR